MDFRKMKKTLEITGQEHRTKCCYNCDILYNNNGHTEIFKTRFQM